jgi:hypothetical protein
MTSETMTKSSLSGFGMSDMGRLSRVPIKGIWGRHFGVQDLRDIWRDQISDYPDEIVAKAWDAWIEADVTDERTLADFCEHYNRGLK